MRASQSLRDRVAVVVPFLGLIIAILGLLTAVFFTIRAGIGSFGQHALTSYRALLEYVQDPPFNVSQAQVASAFTSAESALKANSSDIAPVCSRGRASRVTSSSGCCSPCSSRSSS
jgi:hypothetical protein